MVKNIIWYEIESETILLIVKGEQKIKIIEKKNLAEFGTDVI